MQLPSNVNLSLKMLRLWLGILQQAVGRGIYDSCGVQNNVFSTMGFQAARPANTQAPFTHKPLHSILRTWGRSEQSHGNLPGSNGKARVPRPRDMVVLDIRVFASPHPVLNV